MTAIEPGRIQLLWRSGSYDGMMTGIGLLEGQPVFLDATEEPGGWCTSPRWRELESLLEELLEEEDADDVWDRLEQKYDAKMNEERDRVFKVHEMSSEAFELAKARHRRWQLHGGLHCDFKYDERGVPGYPGVPRYRDNIYWHLSSEYLEAHFYDVPGEDRSKLKEGPLIGTVTNRALYAESDHRPEFPKDPRSCRLKLYQFLWRPGAPVRLDW